MCSGKTNGKDDYVVAGCIKQYFDLESVNSNIIFSLKFLVCLLSGSPSQRAAVG